MQKTLFLALVIARAANGQKIGKEESVHSSKAPQYASAPTSYGDRPACRVKSVQKLATVYEGVAKSPASDVSALSEPDANGVYQIYMLQGGRKTCISCAQHPGGPRVDRNKMMGTWHPSGDWVVMGIAGIGGLTTFVQSRPHGLTFPLHLRGNDRPAPFVFTVEDIMNRLFLPLFATVALAAQTGGVTVTGRIVNSSGAPTLSYA